jgi:hypothetical protein
MDNGLVWLLLFPMVWPFIAFMWLRDTICWKEMMLNILIIVIAVSGVWYAGKYHDMSDIEVWNGQITKKNRDHGSYVVTYPCNCRTVNKSTTCSVCTQTHYTVDWTADSTAGRIKLDHADWTTSAVYLLPDPPQYKNCQVGQPASVEHDYTNYVKAVPDSLFHLNPQLSQYDTKIPSYPRVFDYYKINRVLTVDTNIDPMPLNELLNEELKPIGPVKQVNYVVILTEIDDPKYRLAVENKWLAGKKNDIIIYIGLDGEKITWADATVWIKNDGNELTAVMIRDAITALGTYDADSVSLEINQITKEQYRRPAMERFEYLLDEIDPPLWAVIIALILSIGGSIGLTYYFHKNEVFYK